MQKIFTVILNMLIFFFLVVVLSPNIQVGSVFGIAPNSVVNSVLVGIIYGIFIMLIPNFLKFLKLPVNGGSMILMGIIVSFIFFFVGIYIFGFVGVNNQPVNLGLALVSPIILQDRTVALVFLSIVSALVSIGMEMLNKKK
ncbi:MAG: hypothetical protein ACMG57_00625 [Candidatus Dojkabacteria bacterium]